MARLSSTTVYGDINISNDIDVSGLSKFSGKVEIPNGDLTDGTNVIYDQSASEIPDSAMGSIANSTLTNSSITVTGGTDISGGSASLGGSLTVDHANTSSQGDVSTGGATVIDDITLDGRGHVTNLNTQNRSLDDWATAVDDNLVEFGSNNDFSIQYQSSSDELVIRDEINGVDLIRQPKQGSTEFIQGADIGSIEAPEDSLTQLANAAATSASTSGDTIGYTFAVDNQTGLEVSSTSDGSGGLSSVPIAALGGDLEAANGETIWDESATYIPQGRLQNDTITVTGGTDIAGGSASLGGSLTVDHADTSTQSNVSANAGAAITDIDLDGRGHTTSISTTDFDGRFVLESGDTMSGALTLGGDLTATNGETIWDESATEIPDSAMGSIANSTLTNSSITVSGSNGLNGGTASLGGSLTVGISGNLSLDSDLEAANGETIWDESATEIPDSAMGSIANSTLTNSSITVNSGNALTGGATISLGGSTTLDVTESDIDITNISGTLTDAVLKNTGDNLSFSTDANNDLTIQNTTDTKTVLTVDQDTGDILSSNVVPNNALDNTTISVTGGTDITGGSASLGGSLTVDHADTSTQGSVSTAGSTIISNIDIDGRGHVTDITQDNRSLDDWTSANSDVYMGGNDLVMSASSNSPGGGVTEANSIAFENQEFNDIPNRAIGMDDSASLPPLVKDTNGATGHLVPSTSGPYEIQKNGTDGSGIINFKT